MNDKDAHALRSARLRTPTELGADARRDLPGR